MYDVVIVGGGVAGLSAALVLSRARRSVLVIDSGEPRNAPSAAVHGLLTRDGIHPADLLAEGVAEVTALGAETWPGRVVRAVPLSPGFRVHVADGRAAGARHLLIASGVRDDLPDVPGIAERWGRDVLHCPYCHGYEVRDQVLVVLGTCGHDAEKALLMRQWSRDVTLVLEDPGCVDASDLERLSARGIEVVRGRITELVLHDDALAEVRLADGRSLPAQALVLNPEVRGNDELVRALGASGGDVVRTDECGRTGVPGLWAVGSVGDPVEQVVDAMSAGNRTAIALNHELVMSDADDAVSAARRG